MLNNKKIKEYYNEILKDSEKEYEFDRWMKDPRTREDYIMTHDAINHSLRNVEFASCLEIGPGPGTWTRLLFRKNPSARFDLIDISEEMKRQFELEMRPLLNISYEIADFCERANQKQSYDLVFSSRAIEYMEDKTKFFTNVYESMVPGGVGIFLTKNPYYRKGIRKKDERFQHTGKISPEEIKSVMSEIGFDEIKTYPVVVCVPFIDRINISLSRHLFIKWYKNELQEKQNFFTESYLTICKKKQ